jgi:hypothetical protein
MHNNPKSGKQYNIEIIVNFVLSDSHSTTKMMAEALIMTKESIRKFW